MNGTEITIAVVSLALLFAGGAAWRAWLDYRTKKAAAEAREENIRLFLQQQEFTTQAELEKTRVLIEAVRAALTSGREVI